MDKQPFIVAFPPGNLSDVDRAAAGRDRHHRRRSRRPGSHCAYSLLGAAGLHLRVDDDLLRGTVRNCRPGAGEESKRLITAAGRAAHEFDAFARGQRSRRRQCSMSRSRTNIEAMLKHARKRMQQRAGKPLAKRKGNHDQPERRFPGQADG